jgi:sulfate transport system substrate-binding protein
MKPIRSYILRGAGACAVIATSLVGVSSHAGATSSTINVVGYSIVAPAYTALENAFLQTPAGQGVTFRNSFGASTTQAQNVVAGQAADLVNFSAEPDMSLLVQAGLVSSGWKTTTVAKAEQGMVTDSVVVIVTRSGNPLNIKGWNDLTKSGVQIVTPDPISSGSARWNLLAAYESQILQKAKPAAANTWINKLIGNVISEPTSGSKALTAFLAGTGNVLLAYEADAAAAIASGKAIQMIVPAQNLLIENPAALTTSGATNKAAAAFYKYIFSTVGQAIWESNRFRPTLPSLAAQVKKDFVQPTALTTIAKLGGWTTVTNKFFGSSGIITLAESAHGYVS